MRGIAGAILVISSFTCEPKLGESPETTLLSLASVWVLVSWGCGWLHTSNATIPSAIRTDPMMSLLTMYCLPPGSPTLVIGRKRYWVRLLNWHQLRCWFIEHLATRTAWESPIDWRHWHHNRNVSWMLRRWLAWTARLSIRLVV